MSRLHRPRILAASRALRVAPGGRIALPGDVDPADTGAIASKKQGRKLLEQAVTEISDYQRRLAAQERESVLFVVQALDAGGKDGTIRHVFSGVNPAGVAVHSFKQPTLG